MRTLCCSVCFCLQLSMAGFKIKRNEKEKHSTQQRHSYPLLDWSCPACYHPLEQPKCPLETQHSGPHFWMLTAASCVLDTPSGTCPAQDSTEVQSSSIPGYYSTYGGLSLRCPTLYLNFLSRLPTGPQPTQSQVLCQFSSVKHGFHLTERALNSFF